MCYLISVNRGIFGKMRRILRKIVVLLLPVLLAGCASLPRAGRVIDGDTFVVPEHAVIRLWGIDAPEMNQPFGPESKAALVRLLGRRGLTIEQKDSHYKRKIAIVRTGQQDVALELLKQGLAWHDRRYAPRQENYAEAEAEARAKKRGLWSDPGAIPPWEWRKRHNQLEHDK